MFYKWDNVGIILNGHHHPPPQKKKSQSKFTYKADSRMLNLFAAGRSEAHDESSDHCN